MARDRDRPGGESRGEAPAPTGAIPDMVRRMVTLGLSGFFTTEEALRRAVGDTIPQDWVDFAADQSEKTRRDFGDAVAREVGKALAEVDLAEVLGAMLESRPIEIQARVRLLPADEAGDRAAHFDRMSLEFADSPGSEPDDPDEV